MPRRCGPTFHKKSQLATFVSATSAPSSSVSGSGLHGHSSQGWRCSLYCSAGHVSTHRSYESNSNLTILTQLTALCTWKHLAIPSSIEAENATVKTNLWSKWHHHGPFRQLTKSLQYMCYYINYVRISQQTSNRVGRD